MRVNITTDELHTDDGKPVVEVVTRTDENGVLRKGVRLWLKTYEGKLPSGEHLRGAAVTFWGYDKELVPLFDALKESGALLHR